MNWAVLLCLTVVLCALYFIVINSITSEIQLHCFFSLNWYCFTTSEMKRSWVIFCRKAESSMGGRLRHQHKSAPRCTLSSPHILDCCWLSSIHNIWNLSFIIQEKMETCLDSDLQKRVLVWRIYFNWRVISCDVSSVLQYVRFLLHGRSYILLTCTREMTIESWLVLWIKIINHREDGKSVFRTAKWFSLRDCWKTYSTCQHIFWGIERILNTSTGTFSYVLM